MLHTWSLSEEVLTQPLPERIGPYYLVQVIGEGGMGVVYEAEQREPVRRRVALKMMKLGMDTNDVVGRFETERQSLAVMDHPGIAKVLDAGASEDGRPYFAMELVRGVAIDEFCKLRRLTTRERVELMIGVCEAVQHAHQKGVIHRDLKPSNILVKEEDGKPCPKVIDFGIAKATGQRFSENMVVTSLGQAIGTLAYMSPEQAEMSGLDVDTRTDVYSLGVIMHELLTDRVPMDPASVGQQAFILHLMQRDEPLPTIAHSVAGLDQARLQSAAAERRTDTRSFRKELGADLKWIVSKATEKDRGRRYETANAMALDLRRYLAGEPVLAHAPSTTYRMRKFIRRNRNGVLAASLALMALIAGVIGTTIGLFRAREAEARAAREAEASNEVAVFLANLFELSDPAKARGRIMTARELLDTGAHRVAQGFRDQPQIRARLARTIGEVYTNLGNLQTAQPLLEGALADQRRLLGADDPQTLLTEYSAAELYFYRGEYARADTAYRNVLQRRERVLGIEHPLTIKAKAGVASIHVMLNRWPEAEVALKEAHAAAVRSMGADDPETLSILNNLQALYFRRERYDDAEVAARHVLDARRRLLGADHPQYLTALHNLGSIHAKQKKYREAEAELLAAIEGRRRVEGDNHFRTVGSVQNLGEMYHAEGRSAEAERSYLRVLDAERSTGKLSSVRAQRTIARLVELYAASGQHDRVTEWKARLVKAP